MLKRALVASLMLLVATPSVADGWYGPAKVRDISWIDGFGAVRFSKYPTGCVGKGWFSTQQLSNSVPYLLAAYVKGVDLWYAPEDCTKPYTMVWGVSTSKPTNAVRPQAAATKILESIESAERESGE